MSRLSRALVAATAVPCCVRTRAERAAVNPSLATLVGLAGAVLAFTGTLPQAAKLRRMRSAAGVSVAALANSTVSGLAWATYGLTQHDVWVALPSALTLPATVVAAVLAWSRGGSRERLWLPVAWTGVLVAAAACSLWAGSGLVDAVLGCSVALMVTPAAVTAWRSTDVSALAASAWWLLLLDAMIAGLYGALADVGANLVYAVVAATGSVVVLARLALPARRTAAPLPESLSRESLELAS